MLKAEGPLLIAANHPNSFLDAIILATVFKRPIHSLARGDAFANKLYVTLLHALNIYPIYRESEGTAHLNQNYVTFDICQKLFSKNQIVLIFCEGRCENEWHLRPLKKGTARLALSAWSSNIPLKVLPLGINYDSFKKFGKTVHLNSGEYIHQHDMDTSLSEGKSMLQFNKLLKAQLQNLVYEIPDGNKNSIKQKFEKSENKIKKYLLAVPALIGYLLHAPLYYPIHFLVRNRADGHFDSVMVGLLFLLYPFYILLIALLLLLFSQNLLSLGLLLLMPLTAISLLHYRGK